MTKFPQTEIKSSDTLKAAREKFFAAHGFSEESYSEKWTRIQAGPLHFYMPSSRGRAEAIHWHDLHHVITGYEANWLGEAEIGAWELASGCKRYGAAWAYNTLAVFSGAPLGPLRVARAFLRGLRSRNLYGREIDERFLARPVADVRRELLG